MIIDGAGILIALPSIQKAIGGSTSLVHQAIVVELVVFAVTVFPSGRAGDIVGRKPLLLLGMSLYSGSCVLNLFTTEWQTFLAGRGLVGLATGLATPQIASLIRIHLNHLERGRAFAISNGVLASVTIAGPIWTGLIIDWSPLGLGWRAFFLANCVLALAGLFATTVWMKDLPRRDARSFDLVGSVLASSAVLLLILPLGSGYSGEGLTRLIPSLLAASSLLLIFMLRQVRRVSSRTADLFDIRLLAHRPLRNSLMAYFIVLGAVGGFSLLLPVYMQQGLGLSATSTATYLAPSAVGSALVSFSAGLKGLPTRASTAGGVLILAAVALMAAILTLDSVIAGHELMTPLAMGGAGLSLLLPRLAALILSNVPADQAGSASGLLSAIQNVARAAGVTMIAAIFFPMVASNLTSSPGMESPGGQENPGSERFSSESVKAIESCLDRTDSLNPLVDAAEQCGGTTLGDEALGPWLSWRITQAATSAYVRSLVILFVVFGLGFGLTLLSERQHSEDLQLTAGNPKRSEAITAELIADAT